MFTFQTLLTKTQFVYASINVHVQPQRATAYGLQDPERGKGPLGGRPPSPEWGAHPHSTAAGGGAGSASATPAPTTPHTTSASWMGY